MVICTCASLCVFVFATQDSHGLRIKRVIHKDNKSMVAESGRREYPVSPVLPAASKETLAHDPGEETVAEGVTKGAQKPNFLEISNTLKRDNLDAAGHIRFIGKQTKLKMNSQNSNNTDSKRVNLTTSGRIIDKQTNLKVNSPNPNNPGRKRVKLTAAGRMVGAQTKLKIKLRETQPQSAQPQSTQPQSARERFVLNLKEEGNAGTRNDQSPTQRNVLDIKRFVTPRDFWYTTKEYTTTEERDGDSNPVVESEVFAGNIVGLFHGSPSFRVYEVRYALRGFMPFRLVQHGGIWVCDRHWQGSGKGGIEGCIELAFGPASDVGSGFAVNELGRFRPDRWEGAEVTELADMVSKENLRTALEKGFAQVQSNGPYALMTANCNSFVDIIKDILGK